MKKWAFLALLTLLIVSCNSILRSKPSGTLSEEEMTDLLVDIHLTEATLSIADESLSRSHDTTNLRVRFAQVFKKHDVKPDDFKASLDYYLEHIEELDKIYVEVINRLTEMEANLLPKAIKPDVNELNRGNLPLNNPWFRTLYKPDKPEPIQYFNEVLYPLPDKERFPYLKALRAGNSLHKPLLAKKIINKKP
jgi:hypothetical protein